MKRKIQKSCKKVNNLNFYEKLPVEYLEKFPKLVIEPSVEDCESNEKLEDQPRIFFKGGGNQTISDFYGYDTEDIQKIHTVGEYETSEITSIKNRVKYLKENINLEHCSEPELEIMRKVFESYSFAFQIPGDRFRHTDISVHRINLKPGTNPVFQRQFRIPEYHREKNAKTN